MNTKTNPLGHTKASKRAILAKKRHRKTDDPPPHSPRKRAKLVPQVSAGNAPPLVTPLLPSALKLQNHAVLTGKTPSVASLIVKFPYGRPSKYLVFYGEVRFDHTIIHLLYSGFLPPQDVKSLSDVHPLYRHLINTRLTCKDKDLSPLFTLDPNYATQANIPFSRIILLRNLALMHRLHIPSVIRHLGNDYVGEHLPRAELLRRVKPMVDNNLYNDLKRVLTQGSPNILQGASTDSNFWEYKRYGNHTSVSKDIPRTLVSINKEERNRFLLAFPNWLARFIPHLHLSLIHISEPTRPY